MKLPVVLLAGSLAANATLLATLAFRFQAPSTGTPETSRAAVTTTADPHAAERGAWTTLRGDDPAAADAAALTPFVERLRAAGFPPHVVRSLTEYAVREQLAERRRAALAGAQIQDDYWSVRFNNFNRYDAATRGTLRELAREERRLLRQLLGNDYEAGQEHRWADQRRYYGNLSSEKIEQLQDIMGDYSELRAELREGNFNTITLPEDREKLAYIDREMRQDLAALLSPEELADYELRTSRSLWNLRSALGTIDLAEDEFRTIHSLQKAFDDEFSPQSSAAPAGVQTPESAQRRAEAEKALVAEIKAVLGEPRATEYERSRDYSYRSLEQVTERLGLPKQTAIDTYVLQKDIQQRAAAIRSNRTLSNEQRNAQLTQLSQEAATNLTEKLGTVGLEAYKSNGGQWIDRLVPRTTAQGPNPTGVIMYRPSN